MRIYSTLFLLFAALPLARVWAQAEYDFQLWKSIELQKDLGKSFQINLIDQVRLVNNVNTFGQNMTELTFGYEPLKWLGTSLAYRFSIRPNRNVHRVSVNLAFSHKIKAWRTTFGTRLRGQWDRSDRSTDESEFRIRSRFFARYEPKGKFWKKWSFAAFGELFFLLNTNNAGFVNYRVGGELTFELSHTSSLLVRCFSANEVQSARPDHNTVLQVGVTVNIPHKKKKKEGEPEEEEVDKDKNRNVLPNLKIN